MFKNNTFIISYFGNCSVMVEVSEQDNEPITYAHKMMPLHVLMEVLMDKGINIYTMYNLGYYVTIISADENI